MLVLRESALSTPPGTDRSALALSRSTKLTFSPRAMTVSHTENGASDLGRLRPRCVRVSEGAHQLLSVTVPLSHAIPRGERRLLKSWNQAGSLQQSTHAFSVAMGAPDSIDFRAISQPAAMLSAVPLT